MTNLNLNEYSRAKLMSPYININQLTVPISKKEKLTNINNPTKNVSISVNNNFKTLTVKSKGINEKEKVVARGSINVKSTKPTENYKKEYSVGLKVSNSRTLIVKKKFIATDFIDSKLIEIDSNKTASNGLDSFSVEVNAGRMCNIKLKESDSFITISAIENLPSSLYFDDKDNSIKGVPFILGEHLVVITLANLNKIKLLLKILPDDNFKVL